MSEIEENRTKGEGEEAERKELLRVEDLCFSYEEGQRALSHIHVKIYEGERIAVLGANGAGKSTFFLNLNGVRAPDSGKIWYRGEEVKRKNRRLLQERIGIVFQEPDHQIIASTVRQEVAFGPMNLKLPREQVQIRTERAIKEMELAKFKDRPPHYLSGGEKKRVTIADILAMEPELIVFDEPTASLDPASAQMLEEVLGRLQQQNKTILLSTHDVDLAYRFADRLLIFSEGELIGDGSPAELFKQKELLERARLKPPTLMQVTELLQQKGLLKSVDTTVDTITAARTIEDLANLLK